MFSIAMVTNDHKLSGLNNIMHCLTVREDGSPQALVALGENPHAGLCSTGRLPALPAQDSHLQPALSE